MCFFEIVTILVGVLSSSWGLGFVFKFQIDWVLLFSKAILVGVLSSVWGLGFTSDYPGSGGSDRATNCA